MCDCEKNCGCEKPGFIVGKKYSYYSSVWECIFVSPSGKAMMQKNGEFGNCIEHLAGPNNLGKQWIEQKETILYERWIVLFERGKKIRGSYTDKESAIRLMKHSNKNSLECNNLIGPFHIKQEIKI